MNAVRRFPLLPRSRPACVPLPRRMEQIRTRAHTAAQNTDPERAAAALNLAALLASDCAMPNLAAHLCTRQATIQLATRPTTADTVKLALQPVINLGRLKARADEPDAAYALYDALFTAARTRTPTTIDGLTIDLTHLHGETHTEITRWLWSVVLTDGMKALASNGYWARAADHARRHNAVGTRLLDGRQITIIAHHTAGDHTTARRLLTHSSTPAPWEETVATALDALMNPNDNRTAALAERYLTPHSDEVTQPFRSRIGLCILDLTHRTDVLDALTDDALTTTDAYIARDILTHPATPTHHSRADELRTLVHDASLGTPLTHAGHARLNEAVDTCEHVLRASNERQTTG